MHAATVLVTLAWACWTPYAEDLTSTTPAGDRNDAGILEGKEAAAPDDGGTDGGSAGDAGTTAERYRAAVLADAPHAYWRLDETSELVVKDHSGNKLDANYRGDCTKGVPGPFPTTTAIELSGECEIQAPAIDFSERQPFTLEIWAKPRAVIASYRRLFGHGINIAQGYQHFGVYFREPTGIAFERSIDSQILTAASPAPPSGSFVHVVSVYDGSTLLLYVDGVPVAQTADTRAQKSKSTPFWIGSNGGENFFDGTLAEAAVYAKALAPETIAAHYAIGTQKD